MLLPLLLTWSICPSIAFVPTRFFALLLNGTRFSFNSTITHQDMSRSAILEVAAEVLMNITHGGNHSSLSEESLITSYYGERKRSQENALKEAIRAITNANAEVDLGREQEIAAAHFDSEQFVAGQNRILELVRLIVAEIMASNFKMARMETGRMFHTLQDFYSHSNWIENGNRETYQVLGRENERPTNIAPPDMESCTDCTENGFNIVGVNKVDTLTRTQYNCQGNIKSQLRQSNVLTSGYHANRRDNRGEEIIKPRGKCSHGGLRDPTSDMPATGGINKDSPFNAWSPHYYLHDEAASVAQEATADMLRVIRRAVNDDLLFSMYLGLAVPQTISIAYVIDTTPSITFRLGRDRVLPPEILGTLTSFRANLEEYERIYTGRIHIRYILVPFKEPGTIILQP